MSEAADAEWTRVVSPDGTDRGGGSHPDIARSFHAALPRLKRIVAGMGLTGPAGEDILQSVFVEAMQRPPAHSNEGQLAGWLTRVTTNRCLLEFRQRKRFKAAVDRLTTETAERASGQSSGTEASLARSEELEIMRQVLDELDETLLGPMVLRYFAELNARQIGEVLNLPPGTVRSRLHDARLFLARRMIEKGIEP